MVGHPQYRDIVQGTTHRGDLVVSRRADVSWQEDRDCTEPRLELSENYEPVGCTAAVLALQREWIAVRRSRKIA